MQQQLLPTPPTCTLEQILPSKQFTQTLHPCFCSGPLVQFKNPLWPSSQKVCPPLVYSVKRKSYFLCYTPGTPYKVSCSPTSGVVPPYSSSPNSYQTAVYPVRSAYPHQSPYAQQGTFYTQHLYAAPPHVIHHTTVVQPNGMPATMYPAPIPPPRGNGVTMGMVAGTTMAMSAENLWMSSLYKSPQD
ncbi:myelin-associated neurite-outgrowth inhibitor isoform X4 [Myotis daubentonii]|uniref:myelin-associated neurite-outgrowth inhibitor isoform X4 n=1 Tax=Myotis daubentonii TaxID=98922 RepID=UPI0028735138|nr:myelin-associated neurite-outgrowth inhibitor isoform X4 [Myotis daubentonii]